MTEPHLLAIDEEPAVGSVVAIGYGTEFPEIWVADRANIGNWYSADVVHPGLIHPTWTEVVQRARDRQLPIVLLVPAVDVAWKAGYEAGVQRAISAVENLAGDGVRP